MLPGCKSMDLSPIVPVGMSSVLKRQIAVLMIHVQNAATGPQDRSFEIASYIVKHDQRS